MKKVFPLVLGLVLAGLLLLSMHTISTLHQQRLAQHETLNEKNELDFFLISVVQQCFNENGKIIKELKADRLEHYQTDNSFKFLRPRFIFFKAPEAPWLVMANFGFSKHGQQQFLLKDQVEITREHTKFNSLVKVETDCLTVYPELRTASTKSKVTFLEDANFMQGEGVDVDFNQGFIKLASKVQIWYKINF